MRCDRRTECECFAADRPGNVDLRILRIHSRYLTGTVSGENRSVEDECEVLSQGGHDVAVWTPESKSGLVGLVRAGVDTVWSRSAAATVRSLVRKQRADVVHCDNLFPNLSPAVIRAARSAEVPVVVGLRSYRFLCLAANLQRNASSCEACVGKVPWRGALYRCYQDSLPASAALGASLELHRRIGTFDQVALYLANSEHVRTRYIQGGFPPGRIRVKPNFSWPNTRRVGPGEYYLFLGRLVPEKGVGTLLEAWRTAPGRLLVVGAGPEFENFKSIAPSAVEFMGQMDREEVPRLIRGARAVVVPSSWEEPFGRVAIEAYAAGVPVLASRVGGLADIVADGISGKLLPPSDPKAWTAAAERLYDDAESERLGSGAWRLWNERYSPREGLKSLENAYRHALQLDQGNTGESIATHGTKSVPQ